MDFQDTKMTSIALYDWDVPIAPGDVVTLIDEAFEVLGEQPDRMFIGYEYGTRRERNVRYQIGKKRVRDGLADGYAYLSGVSLFEPRNVRDLQTNVSVRAYRFPRFFAAWRTSHENLRSIERLIDLFCRLRTPRYGMAYRMPFGWGPAEYAGGVLKYGAPETINDNTSSFSRAQHNGEIRSGRLRQLYPVNVLSGVHDATLVGGMPLRTWIANTKNGRLVEVGDNSIWYVTHDQCQEITAILKASNAFITGFDERRDSP